MFEPTPQEPTQVPKILGYGLAIACLIWVLHDFHIMKALRDLAKVDYKWVLLGMGFDVLSYVVQAARWKFLLSPFGKVRLTKAIRAVYAGLFANLVFPLRPGELLRSYLVSNSEGISIGRVLGSVGVERLIDLVIAVAALAVASLMVDLQQFRKIVYTLAIVTLVLLGIVVALILYLEVKLGDRQSFEGRKARLPGKFMSALVDLHAMGTSPSFYPAILFSLLMPACQVCGLWAVMQGYRLHLPVFRGGCGPARHQPGRFASQRSRQYRRVAILLRSRPRLVRHRKIHRHRLLHLRLPRAQPPLRLPGLRGSRAQRPLAERHARTRQPSSQRSPSSCLVAAAA